MPYVSELKSSPVITKLDKPIFTAADIPYDASLIFNAGVIKHNGKYVMIFRNDYGTNKERFENEDKRFDGTSVGVAVSDNGVDGWKVFEKPLIDSRDYEGTEIDRLYDPYHEDRRPAVSVPCYGHKARPARRDRYPFRYTRQLRDHQRIRTG